MGEKYYLRSDRGGWVEIRPDILEEIKKEYVSGATLQKITNIINFRTFFDKTNKKEVEKFIYRFKNTPEGKELYQKRRSLTESKKITKICPFCMKEFKTVNEKLIYCSKDCQKQMQYDSRLQALGKKRVQERDYVHKERKKPEEIYQDSFNTELTGNNSLFCDTEFLESFFRKKIKKSDDCK